MTEQNPETFDLEAWLQDARLPEDSETVYKRGDLVAQINHLARQIRVETDAQSSEMTSWGNPALSKLIKDREKLMDAFAASEMTFYLRAIPREKITEIASRYLTNEADSREERLTKQVHLNRALLVESIVSVESPRLEKRDIKMTVPLVATLEAKIGVAQLTKLLQKRQQVQNELPAPDADFLPSASGGSQDSTQ